MKHFPPIAGWAFAYLFGLTLQPTTPTGLSLELRQYYTEHRRRYHP